MSVHQIWAAVVTVVTVVAAATILSIFGKDATILLLVVTAVVTPVVSALIVVQKISQVSTKVDGVDQKVNGHLSEITKKIPDASMSEVSS